MPSEVPPNLPKGFSIDDFKHIRELRAARVLQEITPEALNAVAGTIPVFCSDGDRAWDIFSHHAETCSKANYPVRPHIIAFPGAPLLLSEDSPKLLGMNTDELFIYGIGTGQKLKSITTVVLVPHWPCGMARQLGISLTRSLALCFGGKKRIKKLVGIETVVVCLHVDYGKNKHDNDVMKTYYVNREQWVLLAAAKYADWSAAPEPKI
ncbi:MAG: hypothetical protein G01um101448_903 [Parcubacteria group bacterium Gr01-1014_48]|nr:MAG: hypothetical protein Greene041614_531 [Parcubacteria group bacterium Greene0416_14]TSC72918.1 MAG: hypothetical protein G01um101448_903 [Parcubacteria group bacterium Gr01-1014_48]TSD00546.1 MAG: hypothetical protein Greene101415_767 [Parcubacteria group bacterium Greene1014_15]TSD07764.1 MAG: hypothetical protein Greene07144_740 [Parcubacteria group bacterium Greene0714_4]